MTKISDAEFRAYLKELREFVEGPLEELQRHCEITNVFPDEFYEMCNEHQLYRISLPEEYGGWGLSELQILKCQEEFSRGPGGMRMHIHFAQDLNWRPLYDFGSQELKDELMPKFGDKSIFSAWCLTEKSGGTGAEAKEFLVKYRFAPTQTNNRINKDTFQKCFDHLYTKFKAYGGDYLLETEGTELIYDAETNKVTGVKAYNPVTNTSYTINAKAVVLATGGFAGSEEMSEKYLGDEYYPLKGKWNICGSWQNDGKMIQAAIDIGAGTFNIGMTPVCHLFGPDGFLNNYPNVPVPGQFTTKTNLPAVWSEGDLPTMLCFWEKVFGVNSKGVRYLPENALATFDAWKGGPNISVIVTEKQIKDIAENGIDVDDTVQHIKSNFDNLLFKVPIPRGTVLPNALQVMEDGVKAGFISKGDTIEELAEDLGLDPATLRSELDKYNEACKSGEDPLGKPAEFLESMEEGPYYAIHAGMHCYGTCAGVDINENFQVLQADGETVIGGLYAVGADGEGVIYSPEKAYVTYGGADNGWALLSGYVAGGKVVENLE